MNDGIEEVEINGVKRGFKFGPLAVAIAEREDGCKAGELFKKMSAGDQLAFLNMFYGAAVCYCKVQNVKVDFNSNDTADWFYQIGVQRAADIINNGITFYLEKNAKSPEKPT